MTGPVQQVPPTEPSLLRRCHENWVETLRSLARRMPGGRIEEEPGVVYIASGIPNPAFNPVFITRPPQDAARTLERATEFMAHAGVHAWVLNAFPESAASVNRAAAQKGLPTPVQRPGMLLSPVPPVAPPLPPGLRIRRATSRPLWETMVRIGYQGFGGVPPDNTEEFLPFVEGNQARGYVGLVKGHPVATSVGFSHAGVGGVFFVATLPEFRGKGYGAALTWRAALEARREGCRASYLQASEMGYPLYLKMGYRHVVDYSMWPVATQRPQGT